MVKYDEVRPWEKNPIFNDTIFSVLGGKTDYNDRIKEKAFIKKMGEYGINISKVNKVKINKILKLQKERTQLTQDKAQLSKDVRIFMRSSEKIRLINERLNNIYIELKDAIHELLDDSNAYV